MHLYKSDKLQYVSEVAAFSDSEALGVFSVSHFLLASMSTE
jgi:hypothetical protein